MLAKRLPVPAYDHLLKLSHTFNLLDARGAVGVTGALWWSWVVACGWRPGMPAGSGSLRLPRCRVRVCRPGALNLPLLRAPPAERANCFATMRSLAREVTGLWLARREEQGYPLGLVPPMEEPPAGQPVAEIDNPGG